MKTKLSIRYFLLGMVFTVGAVYAQAQDYDNLLRNYKLPDVSRKSLDFGLNSRGDFANTKLTSSSYDESEGKTSDIIGNLNMTFNIYEHTRKYISLNKFELNLDGNRSKREDLKTKSINPEITYSTYNRMYKTNKLFFEVNANGTIQYKKTSHETRRAGYNDSWSDNDYNNLLFDFEVPLAVGIGRIENVAEMRQAIYVVQALQQKGVLKENIADHKMIELAELMSKVKNKRFLDSRKHLEYEISTIDSFFVDNRYLSNASAPYFTTLYDYWLYGGLFERKNGTEFKAGITPLLSLNKENQESGNYELETETYLLGARAVLSMEHEKTLNLYWQQSAKIGLVGEYGKGEISSERKDILGKSQQDITSKGVMASGSYSIGYYPNSRTNVNIGLAESYTWLKGDLDNIDWNVYNKQWSTSLLLNTYYYISPQLRLSLEANLSYNHLSESSNFYQREKKWAGNYLLRFTYSLF